MAAGAHENWSSRAAFIFAAVGSAVGLGNIWKFPYEAGEGGGGAFVLLYLIFVFGIGVPVMIAELALGRRGQLSPPNAVAKVASESGRPHAWGLIGWAGIIGAFIVLSFYSVIAGITMSYMANTLTGALANVDAAASSEHFGELASSPWALIGWSAAFSLITVFVVARGIHGGLEKAVTLLMPILFVLLAGLVVYSLTIGDASAALEFLFRPKWEDLTGDTVVQALGQAFFSLSLGLGTMLVYGSYIPRDVSIPRSAIIIAAADTGVALLAGLAIFPIVFQYGMEPAQSFGLVFNVLPVAFAQMPGGIIVGTGFFLLLVVAAVTSSISLLEPMAAFLEEKTAFTRRSAAVTAGVGAFVLGIGSALSFNAWSDVKFLKGTVLDNLDFLTNNLIMPLGGLFIAVMMGWAVKREFSRDELHSITNGQFALWRFMVRYVCPVALTLIFLAFAGVINF